MFDGAEVAEACLKAAAFLERRCGSAPDVAVVAGTGLGELAESMEGSRVLDYGEIPGFPRSTVTGHHGRLVVGSLGGRPTVVFQGRFHLYEGYAPWQIVLPFRAVFTWGVRGLMVTNAAGGLDLTYRAGDLMLITDHINAMGESPLAGPHDEGWGERFPDMSCVYDPDLRHLAAGLAAEQGINLHRGVYAAVKGPNLETPAETRMYRMLGADAIGMSTVPEVIAARQAGVRVLGFSVITNVNDPDCMAPASLDDIVAAAHRGAVPLGRLITCVRQRWPEQDRCHG